MEVLPSSGPASLVHCTEYETVFCERISIAGLHDETLQDLSNVLKRGQRGETRNPAHKAKHISEKQVSCNLPSK
jgi:hypothetical protein